MKLTPTIFLILSLAMYFVLISPLQSEIDVQEIEINALEKDHEKAKSYQIKKDELREIYKKSVNPEEEERLRKFLPDSVDNVRLLIDLEALALRQRLEIGNTAFNSGGGGSETETHDDGLYETITLSFSFVSDYNDFKSFLVLLQQSLRLIDVTKLTVKTSSDPNLSTYEIVINTYWLKR